MFLFHIIQHFGFVVVVSCVWLAKKWLRFGFAKNWGFRFGFSFTKLIAVSVFFRFVFFTFVCHSHLSFMPLWYEGRNDKLPCWIGPTNCQPNWLRTRNTEIRYEEKYFESLTVDPIMLDDELWIRQCVKPSQIAKVGFLKPNCRNLVFFKFWVQLLENWYPTFSSGSAHPYSWTFYFYPPVLMAWRFLHMSHFSTHEILHVELVGLDSRSYLQV